MKKILAVVTSAWHLALLLTACGSGISTEQQQLPPVGGVRGRGLPERGGGVRASGPETAGADSRSSRSSILFCGSTSLYPILSSSIFLY